MFCAITGNAPENPTISIKSGHLFEKSVIEKYVEGTGKCPVTGEPLSADDLLPLKVSATVKPRPLAASSIPGMLTLFQNEWDALMLETYTLKQQLETVRQELGHALYQHDAACRVIGRLIKERDDARVNFGRIDADGSGTLDVGEVHQALIAMDYIVSLQDCKMRLQEFDVDGNGELDFDEFCLMMASTKGGAKSEGKASWAKSLLLGDSSSRSAKSAVERDAASRPSRVRSVPSVKSVPSKPST